VGYNDPNAERAVLGYYLTCQQPDRWPDLLTLELAWFLPPHARILGVMRELVTRGGELSAITVHAALREDDGFGREALTDLQATEVGSPVEYHRIVEERYHRGQLHACLTREVQALTEGDDRVLVTTRLRDALEASPVLAGGRFPLLGAEAMLRRPRVPMLIDGILPAGALAVLAGEPGAGKTFVAIDWGLHIAHCLETWHGRAVQSGHVVYLAAEGIGGLPDRLKAWKAHSGLVSLSDRFGCIVEVVNPLLRSEVAALLDRLRTLPAPGPVLVVCDTLAQSLQGAEENSSEAMGAVVRMSNAIRAVFPACTVLWLHHPSAAGKPLRGHTSLHGATDVELVLFKPTPDSDRVTLRCQKAKDMPHFADIHLRLLPRVDDDGAPLSCVLVAAEAGAPRLNPHGRTALAALARFGTEGATYTKWSKAADLSESSFLRVRHELENAGAVILHAPTKHYTVTSIGRQLELPPSLQDASKDARRHPVTSTSKPPHT
jgi:hypothetical protein